MKKLKKIVLFFCVFLSSFLVFFIPFGARTQGSDSRFGVGAFVLNRYGWREWDRPVGALKDLGASWSREEFIWELIEPERGSFEWEFYDAAMNSLASSGVNILGVLDYSAPWATEDPNREGADKYMPNIEDWSNYVKTVVNRYKNKVGYWQIWNEPNIAMFFKPAPDAGKYFLLLKSAYEVIKRADPNAQVVVAGTSGVDVGYLDQLSNLGAQNYFDVLAVHPYSLDFLSPPESGFLNNLRTIESVNKRLGNKSVWLTELGWPTHTNGGLDEDAQAQYLSRVYLLSYLSSDVQKLFWYDLRNDGDDALDRENNFGLVNRDYSKKQSYHAYQNLIRILGNGQFEKANKNGENGVYDLSFARGDTRIRAIWKAGGEDTITIDENNVRVVDFVGNQINNGAKSPGVVKISGSPIFIISDITSISNVEYGQTLEYEYVDQSPYVSLRQGEEKEIWLKIKNTGSAIWRNNGSNPMVLGTYRSMDRISPLFIDGSWPGSNRPATMREDVARNGETATFVFKVKADRLGEGVYREYFLPLIESVAWMRDIGIYWDITVGESTLQGQLPEPKHDPRLTYRAVYVSQIDPFAGLRGKSEQVELKIKNIGTATWYNYGAHPVRLGTARPLDRNNSAIKAHPSTNNWLSDNRPASMKEREVKPGEIATFVFTITGPSTPGVYKEYFRPVVESVQWMEDFGIYWEIKS